MVFIGKFRLMSVFLEVVCYCRGVWEGLCLVFLNVCLFGYGSLFYFYLGSSFLLFGV